MIIAIDGPAASGKGTLARRIAEHYHVPHYDTGILYRATAGVLLAAGKPLEDVEAAIAAAHAIRFSLFQPQALRGEEIGAAASRIAAMPQVRLALIDIQREWASNPAGAVLDGRDIGLVICPEADVKLFVTASLECRAQRRAREQALAYEHALAEIARRDARDEHRADAPLRIAPDAVLLDTTALDATQAFLAALQIIEARKPL